MDGVLRWRAIAAACVLLVAGCAASSPVDASVDGGGSETATSDPMRISFGGDVMFGRWLAGDRRDYEAPSAFDEVRRHMRESDATIVNLETGICKSDAARRQGAALMGQIHRFTAPPDRMDWLVESGVDGVVVANNHALDCGPTGLEESVEHLTHRNIEVAGLLEAKSRRLQEGVIAFDDGEIRIVAATAHPPPVAPEGRWEPSIIDDAHVDHFVDRLDEVGREHPDALVVASVHWGRELESEPTKFQQRLGRKLIEAGADVVYGHGPHVLQKATLVDESALLYSTGNLHFDMERLDSRKVGLVDVSLEKGADGWRVVDVDEPFEDQVVPLKRRPVADGDTSNDRGADIGDPSDLRAQPAEARPDDEFAPRWPGQPTLEVYFDEQRRRGFFKVRSHRRNWTSEIYPMWKIKLADLDGDGVDQVVVGMWSRQMRHDEPLPRRTVWVLRWDGQRLVPEWRGSGLARPMRDFTIDDAPDGRIDELIAAERRDDECLSTRYRWTGFGFSEQTTELVECNC